MGITKLTDAGVCSDHGDTPGHGVNNSSTRSPPRNPSMTTTPAAATTNPAFSSDEENCYGADNSSNNSNSSISTSSASIHPTANVTTQVATVSTSPTTSSSTSHVTSKQLSRDLQQHICSDSEVMINPRDSLISRSRSTNSCASFSSSPTQPLRELSKDPQQQTSPYHRSTSSSSSSSSFKPSRQLPKGLRQQKRSKSEVVLNATGLMTADDMGVDESEGQSISGEGRFPLRRVGSSVSWWGSKSSWLNYASTRGQQTTSDNIDDNNHNDNNEVFLTADEMVVVERPILTEFDFDQGFQRTQAPKRTPLTWAKKKANKCVCSCACLKGFLLQVFPFLSILRGYSIKKDFPYDVVAGLTVGIMHIPQGMAYGQLSTLPPVYGLYVSFFPVILYFFLGTSRHVSIGTFAVVSLMVGSVVDKGLAANDIALTTWNETAQVNGTVTYYLADNSAEVLQAKLAFAMAVTFAVGCVQLLLGILRLGFLTVYLSDPLISGFTTGAACHVFTSQIKHLFGLEIGRYYGPFKLIYSYRDFFMNLPKSNSVTLVASLTCIVLLVVVKEYVNNNPKVKQKLKMPIPVELVVVVLGTVISHFVNLEEIYDVKIVGDVPTGIPAPQVQQFRYLRDVLSDAVVLGIVAFAISVSMAKILAKKHDYDIDPNQELLAYGTVNVTCSFFSSFCAAASLSRSLVQENVGGRTQVAGLISSALLLVVLLVIGTYFRSLPNCILAAIIVVALKGMFKQFAELRRLWNISLTDFTVWLTSFLATVLLDVDLGLMVGILFALLTVIMRHQRPRACLLGQVPGTDLYKDMEFFKAAQELDHIKIFRFESALFFANSEYFKSSVYKMTADPSVLKKLKRKEEKELRKVQSCLPPQVDTSADSQENTTEQGQDQQQRDRSLPQELGNMTRDDTPTSIVIARPGMGQQSPAPDDCSASEAAQSIRSFPGDGTEPGDAPVVVLPTVTDIYFIIIDCTTMSYVDSVGVKILQQVITEMRSYSVQVFFAHCKAAVRDMFEKTDFYRTSDKECLFLTVHDAVLYAQRLLALVGGNEGDGDRGSRKSSQESLQEHHSLSDRSALDMAATGRDDTISLPAAGTECTKM